MEGEEAIVNVETAVPPEERLMLVEFNELVMPAGVVAKRVTVPVKELMLVAVSVDVAEEPVVSVTELGLELSEKSGVRILADWMASPTDTQSAVRLSPNDTGKLVTIALTFSNSAAMGAPGLDVIMLNPVPADNCAAPWKMPPMIMSLELLVETNTDAPVLVPLAVPGREVFGSNGVLKLAPVMPKAINPLYSPPY